MGSVGKEPLSSRSWPLFAGIAMISISLWTLHQFCDGFTQLMQSPQAQHGSWLGGVIGYLTFEGMCSRQLGPITWVGGLGVVCLQAAWGLQVLSSTPSGLKAARVLAMIGRLIALASLGIVALMLILFNQF